MVNFLETKNRGRPIQSGISRKVPLAKLLIEFINEIDIHPIKQYEVFFVLNKWTVSYGNHVQTSSNIFT